MLAALLIPAVALPLYLVTGGPAAPDVPLAAHGANAEIGRPHEALIVKSRRIWRCWHLDDPAGSNVTCPGLPPQRALNDAAEAHREHIVRLSTPDAPTYADYAEALVMAGQGMVGAEAHGPLRQGAGTRPEAAQGPLLRRARAEAGGPRRQAAFEAFLADTPPDAPWRAMLLAEMGATDGRPPALDNGTMADAADMKARPTAPR